ncbi:LysR family transcriptional regulator [Allorhizobium terrae]|uniref:HTH-type transcriptional regulator TtuA n=1 Tax=Allorhizobium terrae TaxID=1848972 RepID=A0A4S3ZVJ4_9HYPH|nr:LysR family transcriptional regulator [Allorhizobium terrae]THF49633.1 LysR family transcriptional regulator [Allorhizobium terrae]TWD50640.1 DNA-binding transcriptional LysR family regulator [Agrobacterium vitis]
MSINCEILDLRAFLSVVELENFHRAADALNLSQPALSRRIQKLEQVIGAPLLERTTRHVSTTALGAELIPLVRRMLEEFDTSLFSVRDVGSQRSGLVTIACLPTAAFYFLPKVIKQFSLEYPNIRFRILDLPATDGLQAVARGEVEFGINIMGFSDPDLMFERLIEDPFVLAARKDHPLAAKSEIQWGDLAPYQLITVHRSSGNRTLLDAALAKSNLKLRWSFEVTHLSTSLGLVEAGLGISVLPKLATPQEDHPFLVTRPIRNPEISRTIGIVRRRGGTLSPAAERFMSMLIGTWAEPVSSR